MMDHYHCSHLFCLFTYLLLLSTYLTPSNAEVKTLKSHNLLQYHRHELGSFCNPVEGCVRPSLTCHKNRCECAPGYVQNSNGAEECTQITCHKHEDCSLELDPGRRCHQGTCSRCKDGLSLDPVVNRCISRIGYACNRTRDCLPDSVFTFISGSNSTFEELELFSSPLICRNGRCVCRANYYPSDDWSSCEQRTPKCTSHSECNPFGDDPYRYCSSSRQECRCKLGYYEEPAAGGLCLPYVPLQFSLMMPFWLTLIMLTICILIYVSRRLATSGRAAASAAAESNNGSSGYAANLEVEIQEHALNRPPPSYETVVKTTAFSTPQPPSTN